MPAKIPYDNLPPPSSQTIDSYRPPVVQRPANPILSLLFRRPWLGLLALLALPLLWLGVFYLGSLASLLVQSFFYVDEDTGSVVRQFSLQSFQALATQTYFDIVARTALMAAAVTIASAIVGFPIAYFMARFARPRLKGILYLLVILPLWSSYLVRVYSWKLILADKGVINWFLNLLHLDAIRDWVLSLPVLGGQSSLSEISHRSLSVSYLGMFLVFVYIWLPYMILPINAALERVPRSMLEASGDLGAPPSRTLRYIILPLAFPGIVAGSIFTFSLTLGDFIIPFIFGNSSYFIGPAVLTLQGTTGNFPLAAALTTVPIVIMGIYLSIAGRLGAFDAL